MWDAIELLGIDTKPDQCAVGVVELGVDYFGVASPAEGVVEFCAGAVRGGTQHADVCGKRTAKVYEVVALVGVGCASLDGVVDNGCVSASVVLHRDVYAYSGAVDVAVVLDLLESRDGNSYAGSVYRCLGDGPCYGVTNCDRNTHRDFVFYSVEAWYELLCLCAIACYDADILEVVATVWILYGGVI